MSNRRRMSDVEFEELRARVRQCAPEIAEAYWGPPLYVDRDEMRFGTKTGSLKLTLWPPDQRGLWIDFGDGNRGGDMFTTIREHCGGDWGLTLQEACRHTGFHPPSWDVGLSDEQVRILVETAQKQAEERARAQAEAEAKAQRQGAGAYAARIAAEAVPIAGTLAERYVRDVRFGGHDLRVPSELSFHPAVFSRETGSTHPALIVRCVHNRRLARVQAIFLDPVSAKKADLRAPKRIFGKGHAGVPASFTPWIDNPTWQFVCEGPEDAAVINSCTGECAAASLGAGSLGKPCFEPNTPLVLIGDNDATGRASARRAATAHRERGSEALIIYPPDGLKDANDVLLQRGPDGVRQWVKSAIEEAIEDAKNPKPPGLPAYYPPITEPREHAKRRQDDIILTFLANATRIADARRTLRRMRAEEMADQPDLTRAEKAAITRRLHHEVAARFGFGQRIPKPPRTLLTGSQGTGKTSVALEGIAAIEADIVVHKYAPTLQKCYEDLEDYQKFATARSMPVYVVHGRGQDDPQQPDTKMCPRFVMVKRVVDAGLSPRQRICPTCKLRQTCGTLRQEREIAELGNRALFIMASAYAFLPTPAPEPGIIAADECLTIDTVATTKISPDILTATRLVPYRGGDPGPAMEAGRTLDAIRQALTEPELDFPPLVS